MTRLAFVGAVVAFSGFILVGCGGETVVSADAGPTARGFCEAPLRLCGGDCVSLESDPNHCGGCGQPCQAGSFCDLGTCSTQCSDGLTQCGASCADLMTDRTHCGACDVVCGADRMCIGGNCACPPGTEDCGGTCVDTQTEIRHCGMCNLACETDEICASGACVCRTGTRETQCTDGVDDDCDGLVDCDDPDCEGAPRRCNGACGAGVETCSGGTWGACEGGSGEAEICGDGVDQDCMGGDERNPDMFEPNNSCAQCTSVEMGRPDPDTEIMASFDSVDDDVDCYRFFTDDGVLYQERIQITLDGVPEGHDYDIYLYRDQEACEASNPLVFSAAGGNAPESIDWGERLGADDGGTYFLRVVRFTGHSCTEGYRLTINGLD